MKLIQCRAVVSLASIVALIPACTVSTSSAPESVGSENAALGVCAENPIAIAAATASSEQNSGHFSAAILGAAVPSTNCGVMLQSYTLAGATLTRVN